MWPGTWIPWKITSMGNRSQFDILILPHWWLRLWWWNIDAAVVCCSMLMNRIGIGLSMPPVPVLITDSLYWNVFSSWTEYIQWQKVAGPAWPLHGCIGPKNRQLQQDSLPAVSGVAPTVPNHCLLHIPPPEPCPSLDWQLPNICQADCSLLILSSSALSNFGRFVDFEWAATVGGREVNVWRPNAARRSNLGFSSPGEWAKPHFNKLGFPVINPWMKGSEQGGCVGPPPNKPPQLAPTPKVKALQWQILHVVLYIALNTWLSWYFCPQYDPRPAWEVLRGLSPLPALLHKVVGPPSPTCRDPSPPGGPAD